MMTMMIKTVVMMMMMMTIVMIIVKMMTMTIKAEQVTIRVWLPSSPLPSNPRQGCSKSSGHHHYDLDHPFLIN